MKLERWTHPIFVGAAFGACIGFVLGLRSIDTVLEQDFYWIWLGGWVFPGAVIGAVGGVAAQIIYQLVRRR